MNIPEQNIAADNCDTFENIADYRARQREKQWTVDCPYNNSVVKCQGHFSSDKDNSPLSRKEKRAFQRMVTGLSIANYQLGFMRFMTLTTAPGVPQTVTIHHKDGSTSEMSKMHKDFNALQLRIKRATEEKDGFEGFKFNRYFNLRTAEGYGVFHIVYWGNYIPQKWLSQAWTEIHQSPIVHIEACFGGPRRNVKGLVGYLLTHYLTKQPILRMSYGWKWAWLGFCRSWNHLKKVGEIRCSAKVNEKPILVPVSSRHRCWDGDHTSHVDTLFKYTETKSQVPVFLANQKFRKTALELWDFLMRDPPPTSRQVKFCNPDHSKYNNFKDKVYWYLPMLRCKKLIKTSLKPKLEKTAQHHLCKVDHTAYNHYFGFPTASVTSAPVKSAHENMVDLGYYDEPEFMMV